MIPKADQEVHAKIVSASLRKYKTKLFTQKNMYKISLTISDPIWYIIPNANYA